MITVVELSVSKPRGPGNAEYAAKDGYRQAATEQIANDQSEGEKTLGYFRFEDAKFGGKLHIPFYDEYGSSDGGWEVALTIK
jgi:hypothetical protein